MFLARRIPKLIRQCQPLKESFYSTFYRPLSSATTLNHVSEPKGCVTESQSTLQLSLRAKCLTINTYRLNTNGKTGPTNESSDAATSFYVQDDEDFQTRVLESKVPIVVDFYADWCGPCKLLTPRIMKEVDRHNGKILLAKVNVDDFGQLAMEEQIMAVPTIKLYKGGKVIDELQGNVDDDILEAFISKAVES